MQEKRNAAGDDGTGDEGSVTGLGTPRYGGDAKPLTNAERQRIHRTQKKAAEAGAAGLAYDRSWEDEVSGLCKGSEVAAAWSEAVWVRQASLRAASRKTSGDPKGGRR